MTVSLLFPLRSIAGLIGRKGWWPKDGGRAIGKIAFMHVPKTGGVSVIDAFTRQMGAKNCSAFLETISDESFRKKAFVAGHVYRRDITANAFVFTFLRNPYEQIVSHLQWIDHYNMPEFAAEAEGFSESIRYGIRALKNVDFSEPAAIDRYLCMMPECSALRIVNLQSEMLAFRRGRVEPVSDAALSRLAISNLGSLSFIGLSERLDADLAAVFRILGLPADPVLLHLNKSPSRRLVDLRLPGMRASLRKHIQADLYLYDHVLKMRMQATAAAGRPPALHHDLGTEPDGVKLAAAGGR